MVNVLPVDDTMTHQPHMVCSCLPAVSFFDPLDGQRWEGGPIVTHNPQDGRDVFEQHGFPSGKKWMTVRS